MKEGDVVRLDEECPSHVQHGIKGGGLYVVTKGNAKAGISVNNDCEKGNYCDCHKNLYWSAACFSVVDNFTPEEIDIAKSLPSADDTAAFFQVRAR